jgi:hypothetical protein
MIIHKGSILFYYDTSSPIKALLRCAAHRGFRQQAAGCICSSIKALLRYLTLYIGASKVEAEHRALLRLIQGICSSITDVLRLRQHGGRNLEHFAPSQI